MNNKLPISICILNWKSPLTLRNTLESYVGGGLLDLTDDVIMFCQEIQDYSRDIAEEFGINYIISTSGNIGIGRAINELVKSAKYETVIFVEEDWELIEDRDVTREVLQSSLEMLDTKQADFVRLRHIFNYGSPLYTLQFKGDEMRSPIHLIESIHWLGRDIATKYPEYASIVSIANSDATSFVVTDSAYGNHSNNPAMFKKDFYMKNIYKYADSDGIALEGNIIDDWRKAGHKVAYNLTGLFCHKRLDR